MAGQGTVRLRTTEHALPLLLQLVAAAYAPPRRSLEQDLQSGDFSEAVQQLADALGVDLPSIELKSVTTLQPAYVELFVTSGRRPITPPYAGYAIDGELLGPSAESLGRFLEGHGIGTDPNWRDLPDHIAAVAEAGAILAAASQDEAAMTVAVAYLAPWFDRYATEVAQSDASGFYGPLTQFLHASLQEVQRGHRP